MIEHKYLEIKVERNYPDDLRSYFVSNIVIQHQPDFFILSFFELWPPAIVADTEEEKKIMVDSLTTVEAKCVARIVLTPARMKELQELIAQNLSSYAELLQTITQEEQKEG
jgi:hypothetical protein